MAISSMQCRPVKTGTESFTIDCKIRIHSLKLYNYSYGTTQRATAKDDQPDVPGADGFAGIKRIY